MRIGASRRPTDSEPPRMGALAKLPVFFDLKGKRVVVSGGTAPAAWKAELLAAAGANVEIYAIEVSPEMTALVARGSESGSLVLRPQPWSPGCLCDAAMALADVATEAEAQDFFRAASAAGVPVNVIDKPAFCQFQFGSIVNRSPVVIGISTDGGAPILGQAIRRRIETLLPASLAAWGRLAKELRDQVACRLAPGAPRRDFWERFSERAFGAAPRQAEVGHQHDLIQELADQRSPRVGSVTLVGAGPGDAELLTIKAVRAMQSADVILFDDLVSADVLELARREAKRLAVGKRGQRNSCDQGDINALMLKLALQGKRVVRLKSGDPMIFGRAGEEIAALEAAGIAVNVVPGITSALAMAARLGVSLTHRDHAQSVRFVTGHARDGSLPSTLDWRGLADPSTTLIVYMGGRTASSIAERLTAEGLSAATPAIAMSAISQPDECRWTGTLETLGAGIAGIGHDTAVLIGIGRAFCNSTERANDGSSECGVNLQSSRDGPNKGRPIAAQHG